MRKNWRSTTRPNQIQAMNTLHVVDKLPTTCTDTKISRRIEVWKETQQLAPNYPYKPSQKYTYRGTEILCKIYNQTRVVIQNIDTLEAAHNLVNIGHNPLILNFADDLDAGGCVENGSGAQEESLWRRTNLCMTQTQTFYPLQQDTTPEAIYTPMATVFRDTEANDYAYLSRSWQASFVALPGLKYPTLNALKEFNKQDKDTLIRKIRLLFQIATKHHHETLVLGPLGCGAWRCPPSQVAKIFQNEIYNYNGVFHTIVFACMKTPTDSQDNYKAFCDTFIL